MSDGELLDWFEVMKGQCWFDKKQNHWTVFITKPGFYPVQPSGPTLRGTIKLAHELYYK